MEKIEDRRTHVSEIIMSEKTGKLAEREQSMVTRIRMMIMSVGDGDRGGGCGDDGGGGEDGNGTRVKI